MLHCTLNLCYHDTIMNKGFSAARVLSGIASFLTLMFFSLALATTGKPPAKTGSHKEVRTSLLDQFNENLRILSPISAAEIRQTRKGNYALVAQLKTTSDFLRVRFSKHEGFGNDWDAAWRHPEIDQVGLTSNESFNLVNSDTPATFDKFMGQLLTSNPFGISPSELDSRILELPQPQTQGALKVKFSRLPGLEWIYVRKSPQGFPQLLLQYRDPLQELSNIFSRLNFMSKFQNRTRKTPSNPEILLFQARNQDHFNTKLEILNATLIEFLSLVSAIPGRAVATNFQPLGHRALPPACRDAGSPCPEEILLSHFYQTMRLYRELNAPIVSRNPEGTLRLASFNVFAWQSKVRTAESVAEAILEIDADIIGLQEAVISRLPETLSNKYAHIVACEAPKDFGNMILSRYPIRSSTSLSLPSPQAPRSPRCAVSALVQTPIGPLLVANTQLDVFDESAQTRMSQLTQIGRWLNEQQKVETRQILMGDFNALRRDEISPWHRRRIERLDYLRGVQTKYREIPLLESYGFRDSFVQAGLHAPTSTVWSGRRVDYIFSRDFPLRQSGAYLYFTDASDHIPLVVDVSANAQGESRQTGRPLKYPGGSSEGQVSYQVAREKLYAVHATNYFPKGEIKLDYENVKFGSDLLVHWSLGELVQPHAGGSWEETDFAVITALKNLEPQLVNVNAYDTTTFGNFAITRDTLVLVPESFFQANKALYETHIPFGYIYDDKVPLREAVKTVIRDPKLKGWPITMKPGANSLYDPAMMASININTYEFFRPLLKTSPHVSFGDDIESITGNAYCYGAIDQILINVFVSPQQRESWSLNEFNGAELKLALHILSHCLTKISEDVSDVVYRPREVDFFGRQKGYIDFLATIIKQEILLRTTKGRSLLHLDNFNRIRGVSRKLLSGPDNQELLTNLQLASQPLSAGQRESDDRINRHTKAELLLFLTQEDKRELARRFPEMSTKVEKRARFVSFNYKGKSYKQDLRCINDYWSLRVGDRRTIKEYCRKRLGTEAGVTINTQEEIVIKSITSLSP